MSQPAISLAMLPLGASGPSGTPKTLTLAATVDGDVVINEPTTSVLTIDGLVTLNGRLIVRAHALLTEIVCPDLEHCEGVEIAGNSSLTSVDLSALESADGTLKLILNPKLAALDLSALATVRPYTGNKSGGNIVVRDSSLAAFSLPALVDDASDVNRRGLFIERNPLLTSISAPLVTGSQFQIFFCRHNPALETLHFPALTAANFYFYGCDLSVAVVNAFINGLGQVSGIRMNFAGCADPTDDALAYVQGAGAERFLIQSDALQDVSATRDLDDDGLHITWTPPTSPRSGLGYSIGAVDKPGKFRNTVVLVGAGINPNDGAYDREPFGWWSGNHFFNICAANGAGRIWSNAFKVTV